MVAIRGIWSPSTVESQFHVHLDDIQEMRWIEVARDAKGRVDLKGLAAKLAPGANPALSLAKAVARGPRFPLRSIDVRPPPVPVPLGYFPSPLR